MNRTLVVCALASALAVDGARAQSPLLAPSPGPSPAPTTDLRASFVSLSEDNGALWALGRAWRAEVLADGVDFTPFFGKSEPVTRHLRYRLTEAGRASAMTPVPDPSERRSQDLRVTFARGGLTEVYDVLPEGLEQSFVFDRIPKGSGDLVVRGAIETNLQVAEVKASGIRLIGSNGSMTIGAVLGLDAAGRTVRGSLHLDGDTLELRLPAAFVDHATAPITVDPLIGSVQTITTSECYEPDVAYDASNDNWCVTWYETAAGDDGDIRAQLVAADGTLQGNGLAIRTGGEPSVDPRVANNNLRDMFVIAWIEDNNYNGTSIVGDVTARTVKASDGTRGTVKLVSTRSEDELGVDVGGNRDPVSSNAAGRVAIACTLEDPSATGPELWAYSINVNTDGTLSVHGGSMIGIGADDRHVTVSDATADDDAWWFVWTSWHIDWTTNPATAYGGADDPRDLYGAYRTTTLGNRLSSSYVQLVDGRNDAINQGGLYWYAVSGPGGGIVQRPTIANRDNKWFIAYQVTRANNIVTNYQVNAAAIEYYPRTNTLEFPYNWRQVASDTTSSQYRPAAAWGADSVLVTYIDTGATNQADPWIWEGDFDCKACTTRTQLAGDGEAAWVAIASKTSGGASQPSGEESLITYSRNGGNSEWINYARFRSDDGIAENLGGSCLSGDDTVFTADCAMVANDHHTLRIANARANEAAMLFVGFEEITTGCGTCSFKVEPFSSFVFVQPTDGNGVAALRLPIPDVPALAGLTYVSQWVVPHANGPGCLLFQADFTDALRVTIQ